MVNGNGNLLARAVRESMPSELLQNGSNPVHGVSLRDVIAAVRRYWYLPLITTLLTSAATWVLIQREVRQYAAFALIRLVDQRTPLTGDLGDPPASSGKGTEWIQSQLLVLLSRGLAGEVVDRQGLRLIAGSTDFARGRLEDVAVEMLDESSDSVFLVFNPTGVIARRAVTDAIASYGETVDLGDIRFVVPEYPGVNNARLLVIPREAAIDNLQGGLAAWSRSGTDAIDVRFTATDRRMAVRVVNSVVEAFRDENARAAKQQATRRKVFLEEQLRQNDAELRDAQNALIAFRSHRDSYSSAERIAAEQSNLMQLEMRRQELDADRKLFASMLGQAREASGDSQLKVLEALVSAPGLGQNAQVSQLFSQILSSRAELNRLEAQYTELHPEVRRVNWTMQRAQEQLASAVETHLATMAARVAALDELRARAMGRLAILPSAEAEEVRLVHDVETARSLRDQLRGEYQRARTTEAVESGQVSILNLAARASAGDSHRRLKLAIGALFGLFIGLGLAFLLDRSNSSIRQAKELSTVLRLAELGIIPRENSGRLRGGPLRRLARITSAVGPQHLGNGNSALPALVTAARSRSPGSEAYRGLRTTLMYLDSAKGVKTIVVTSAGAGDGKSTVAANLAVSFAHQGLKVLLIDGDLRRPRLHDFFRQRREPGLADLLTSSAGPAQTVRSTGVEGLDLITCGTVSTTPAELLGSERMTTLLEAMRTVYDLVILDAPPVLAAADATALAAKVDGVLFLVRAGATHRDAAQFAIEQLERVGARLIGAVLNDPEAVVKRYGRYYEYEYATDG